MNTQNLSEDQIKCLFRIRALAEKIRKDEIELSLLLNIGEKARTIINPNLNRLIEKYVTPIIVRKEGPLIENVQLVKSINVKLLLRRINLFCFNVYTSSDIDKLKKLCEQLYRDSIEVHRYAIFIVLADRIPLDKLEQMREFQFSEKKSTGSKGPLTLGKFIKTVDTNLKKKGRGLS